VFRLKRPTSPLLPALGVAIALAAPASALAATVTVDTATSPSQLVITGSPTPDILVLHTVPATGVHPGWLAIDAGPATTVELAPGADTDLCDFVLTPAHADVAETTAVQCDPTQLPLTTDAEKAIVAQLGAGDDLVSASHSPVTVSLDGQGDDDILEGSEFADTLAGGAGNDRLIGLAGADTATGGVGNDVLLMLASADLTSFPAADPDTSLSCGDASAPADDGTQDVIVRGDDDLAKPADCEADAGPLTLTATVPVAGSALVPGTTVAADVDAGTRDLPADIAFAWQSCSHPPVGQAPDCDFRSAAASYTLTAADQGRDLLVSITPSWGAPGQYLTTETSSGMLAIPAAFVFPDESGTVITKQLPPASKAVPVPLPTVLTTQAQIALVARSVSSALSSNGRSGKALKRGIKLKVTAPSKGKLVVELRLPVKGGKPVTIATAGFTAKGPGSKTLTLKLSAAGREALAAAKAAKGKVSALAKVSFAPAGGKKVTAELAVALRR
jgi:hypothetical protein